MLSTLINIVFRPFVDKFDIIHLDDILIYSKTRKERLKHLKTVFDVLRN